MSLESRYGICLAWKKPQKSVLLHLSSVQFDGKTNLAIRQGVNDHTEGRQRLIDLLGLLQSLTRCSSLADLLGTSKINEIQVACFLSTCLCVPLVDGDEENGM